MLNPNEEIYCSMKSLCSPASAKTFKTFQSHGKLVFPNLLSKRNDFKFSWSIKGFEKTNNRYFDFKQENPLKIKCDKQKKNKLKKIVLKDCIINAIAEEMKSIPKLYSVKNQKKFFNKFNDEKSINNSVKTKKFFLKTNETNQIATVKNNKNFNFDFSDEEMSQNNEIFKQIEKKNRKLFKCLKNKRCLPLYRKNKYYEK